MSKKSPNAESAVPKLLAAFSVVAVVLVLGIVWMLASALVELRAAGERHRRIQQLCGTIVHLDEVLTMSTKMCAATGNMAWKQRYDIYVKELDKAIEEAETLVPLGDLDPSAEISAVNARLVAMEQQAFRLSAEGKQKEAAALLESQRYELDKQKYSQATQDRVDAMLREVAASLSGERWRIRATVTAAMLVTCLILGSCIICLRVLRQHLIRRKQAEDERERLIADLEAQNTELDRFTYTVSHDLKSPLVTIQGHLGILNEDLGDDCTKEISDSLAHISNAADKMHRLLVDLLELSRAGRAMNPPESVALADLTREALELVCRHSPKSSVQITVAPDLPVVQGDRTRLREVMQNLIDNAIKHMGTQGEPRIEVGWRRDAETTVCYVRDNGIGIDPCYHERVFGLFEKLDQTAEGTGVGLALVKRIIEVHGGRVWVESEGNRKGSTFCFTLP